MGSISASSAASRGSGGSSLRSMISTPSGGPGSTRSPSSSLRSPVSSSSPSSASSVIGACLAWWDRRWYPSGRLDGVNKLLLHDSARRSSVWVRRRRPGALGIGMRRTSSPGGESRRGEERAIFGGDGPSSTIDPSGKPGLWRCSAVRVLGEMRAGVRVLGRGEAASGLSGGGAAGPTNPGSPSASASVTVGFSLTSKFCRYSSPKQERSASTGGG